MKLDIHEPPRKFSPLESVELKDMGTIVLAENEQVTFETDSGKSNDFVRKNWGFYLSNSLNSTLSKQGFKTAFVVSYTSESPRYYLNLVEIEKMDEFQEYLKEFNSKVVCWLDEWQEKIDS